MLSVHAPRAGVKYEGEIDLSQKQSECERSTAN